MWPPKHFVISVALSIIVIAVGTIGHQSIEGWNFLDSIYMTIITIATVGYAEVHELGDAGKVFTIILRGDHDVCGRQCRAVHGRRPDPGHHGEAPLGQKN